MTTRMFTHTGPRRGDVFAESTFAKQIAMIEQNLIDPVVKVGNLDSMRTFADVRDAVKAYYMLLESDEISPGETFNIGGKNEWRNIDIVRLICSKLDKILPARDRGLKINSYAELIEFVTDRPGHDTRYSINTKKIEDVFNWFPEESFETGLEKTIFWYINNLEWIDQIKKKNIREKKW